jgi:hypothetical protein
MSTACLLAWVAVLLLLPALLLFHLTESRSFKVRRWRRQGLTWRVIADRLDCSPSTAKRWAAA